MAVGDAYGAEEHRTGDPGTMAEQAWRTERIDRSTCRSVAEFSFRTASRLDACVYGGPKWTVSTVYEGMLKEEMDAAAALYPDVPYRPTLIDAAYAGLLTESSGSPLVVPALNRDGDCLSDLVLALFGSIAGAESVLLALDEQTASRCRHGGGATRDGAVADGQERGQPDGDAPGLRRPARPRGATAMPWWPGRPPPSAGPRSARRRDGIRTFDLGGEASTSEVVDEVLLRLRRGAAA